jgi:hypothetical protein
VRGGEREGCGREGEGENFKEFGRLGKSQPRASTSKC